MSEKKPIRPNVVPSKEQIDSLKAEREKMDKYEQEKMAVTNEIYTAPFKESSISLSHLNALEQMRERTASQLAKHAQGQDVVDNKLIDKTTPTYSRNSTNKNDTQLELRDAQLAKNRADIDKFQQQTSEALNRHNSYEKPKEEKYMEQTNYTPIPPTNTWGDYHSNTRDENINQISQPNYNAPFDVITLPSLGKTYKSKKPNVKLSYMTTADENILSSPNLLQSGEFLEILINRKLLEPTLRYKDLLPGDRNAIMLWLRATSYGEMYPITIADEEGVPFETVINLDELKTIELTVDPDENGLFSFILPISQKELKFKLLTCGEIDYLDKLIEDEKENDVLVNNYNTYKLERMIVEVDGSRDRTFISDIVNNMRIPDSKALNNFINTIDCGIDLDIVIETPGGGSIATFLPLNLGFFWPDLQS